MPPKRLVLGQMVYDEAGNVVANIDAEGNILSEQIILAPVPEEGELGEKPATGAGSTG